MLHRTESRLRRKCLPSSLLLVMSCLLGAGVRADESLYLRLGGDEVVGQLVHQLIEASSTDPVTRRSFAKFNRPRLEKLLQQHICHLAGGGCQYEGDSMKDAHAGLDITEAEFYGMVHHLRAICDRLDIDQQAKNELLTLLAPMKRQIITK